MATNRKKHRAPVPVFQRDPGPWSRLLIDWLATLAVIMIFGLVMLFSASYTTGYLRMGDSFHYIKQQALCMILGLGCMFLISYVDHRFLRKMVVPGYFIVLAMLAVTLTMAPLPVLLRAGSQVSSRAGQASLQTRAQYPPLDPLCRPYAAILGGGKV